MEMNRAEFLEVLQLMKPGLARKKVVEQMSHVMFTGEQIRTFNDKTLVSFPWETDFQCSVDAEKLIKILEKMDQESVILTQDGVQLKIISNPPGVRAGLTVLAEDDLSGLIDAVTGQIEENDWKEVPEDFLEGLELCNFSVEKDEALGTATCVQVTGNHMFSGNRHRVSCYTLEKAFEDTLLIKGTAIPGMLPFFLTHYNLTKSWIHFKTEDGLLFSIRRVMGEFPPYGDLFKKEFIGTQIPFPTLKLKNALASALVVHGEIEDKQVEMQIRHKILEVRAKGKNNDWIEVEVPIEYEGETLEISVNPVMFTQALETAASITLVGRFVVFKTEKFIHLIAKYGTPEKK